MAEEAVGVQEEGEAEEDGAEDGEDGGGAVAVWFMGEMWLAEGMVWYGMVWYGMVWYGMVWYGMVWYGMVWYGMVWQWHGRSKLAAPADGNDKPTPIINTIRTHK